MALEGSAGVDGILKRLVLPFSSKTKSVKVPPVSTPTCLPTDVHPTTALIRLTDCVEDQLHAITILETRSAVHHLPATPQRLDNTARKRRKPARPTALTHPLGHVVLIDLHRTP